MAENENEQLHASLQSEPLDFQALFDSKDAIEFVHPDGHREIFQPDGFKGYFPFTVATGFPSGRTAYGIGIHPQTVANHYRTLLHQHSDSDHKMKFNDPANPNAEDKILGAIVAVSFPRPPNGAEGWKITDQPAPAIKGVGVFWKNAAATMRAFSKHMMGNHRSSVSMDLFYGHEDSGFAIKGGEGEFAETTPKEFSEAGYQYVPYAQAPKELRECFVQMKPKGEKSKTTGGEDVVKNYKGRQVTFLAGGSGAGMIAFAGLAVVRYGAEPTAALGHLLAFHPAREFFDSISELSRLIREAGASELVKAEAELAASEKVYDAEYR